MRNSIDESHIDEHPVTIEKYGAAIATFERGASDRIRIRVCPELDQRTDSHFAIERARMGCVTKRCQITAHKPSVCGVT